LSGRRYGKVAHVTTPLEDLVSRHIEAGTVPGAVALLGTGDVEVVAAGVASMDGQALRDDAIMRIQSMTKAVTSVAALRLVEAGQLGLDQSLEEWLPELADRRVSPVPLPNWTTRCRRTVQSPFATC
jgi:CubicO group peptidase (beta-lactamase class C family)